MTEATQEKPKATKTKKHQFVVRHVSREGSAMAGTDEFNITPGIIEHLSIGRVGGAGEAETDLDIGDICEDGKIEVSWELDSEKLKYTYRLTVFVLPLE